MGSRTVADTQTSDIAPDLGKKFLDIEATIECWLTLRCARDMIRTKSYNFEWYGNFCVTIFNHVDS